MNWLRVSDGSFWPNRQFAATQHRACYGSRTGLSSDVAGTAVPGRTRTSAVWLHGAGQARP